MKKVLGLSLSALMVASLAGCSGKITSLDYVNRYTSDPSNMDYVTTALQADHEHNANFVDGLLENDPTGKFVGALAESWEMNEDATEFTFKLRKGVQWVTSEGEVYAELNAKDFVTGLQHAADFNSGTSWLVMGLVKNYSEYLAGEVEFSEVGVEAVDDYTVKYTLNYSAPYFYTFGSYNILMPINEEFLNSKGEGCKLGAPDKATCSFGSVDPSSILYNGGYILSSLSPKSEITYKANPNYWDKDHVYIQNVTLIYDDGSDPYAGIVGFENGTYASASLSTSWGDFDTYKEKYADYYYTTLPNSTNFGILFNFNRTDYAHTSHTTDADKANTKAALLNYNFRAAFRAAFDRVAYLSTSTPKEVAIDMLRNVTSVPNLVTTEDGKEFGELVNAAYAEMTGETVNLADGQDPWLNPEKAMEYINAAKADGIQFPVTLDMPTLGTSKRLVTQCQSMKDSVEKNTQGNIIINVIQMDYDTLVDACYGVEVADDADYDINSFTGWGPDYPDPKTFMDLYSITEGSYMPTFGLHTLDDQNYNSTDAAAMEAIGLDEYEKMYQAAKAITDDTTARYEAFAKCDAKIIAEVLYIPCHMDARGYVVTKVVPFTKSYSQTGISEYKYKFMQVQEDMVTKEQYDKAYDEWQKARA